MPLLLLADVTPEADPPRPKDGRGGPPKGEVVWEGNEDEDEEVVPKVRGDAEGLVTAGIPTEPPPATAPTPAVASAGGGPGVEATAAAGRLLLGVDAVGCVLPLLLLLLLAEGLMGVLLGVNAPARGFMPKEAVAVVALVGVVSGTETGAPATASVFGVGEATSVIDSDLLFSGAVSCCCCCWTGGGD